MINLIPMAGEGSRFKVEGYSDPKPLITVAGKPMVIQACDSLPKPDRWVFVCRNEHLKRYPLEAVLKDYASDVSIRTVDQLTEGQASTCLLAKDLIDNQEELMIAASDNGMIWQKERFEQLKERADAIVWTFRNNVTVKAMPQSYGWVLVNGDLVTGVSVKVPISNTPMQDHAIVGSFWFRYGSIFVNAAEKMISENKRVNNEFYVDETINYVIGMGFRVLVMEIDNYICWGTPSDLKVFEYWQKIFDTNYRDV